MSVADPEIAESAHRHGISDIDILHAYRTPIGVFEGNDDLAIIVGANFAGRLLEVGVDFGGAPRIVHAMKARDRYVR